MRLDLRGWQQAAGIFPRLHSYLVELIANTFPSRPAPGCQLLLKCLQSRNKATWSVTYFIQELLPVKHLESV